MANGSKYGRQFSSDFDSGADLFFKSMGIKNEKERQIWIRKVQEAQLEEQGFKRQLMEEQVRLGREPISKYVTSEIEEVPAPEYQPGQGMAPFAPGATIEQPTGKYKLNIPSGTTMSQMGNIVKAKELYGIGAGEQEYTLAPGAGRFKGTEKIAEMPAKDTQVMTDYQKARIDIEKKKLEKEEVGITEYQKRSLDIRERALDKPLVSIDISGKAMTEMGKVMGKKVVDDHKDALAAKESLARLKTATGIINSGMITGYGAEYIVSFGKMLQQAGISLAPNAIANTEAYAALMGSQVGQIIQQFGQGTGLSDADREYAASIAGARITLTEQSLRKIIELNETGLKNIIKNHNIRANQIMSKPDAKDLPYDLRIDMEEVNKEDLRKKYNY